MGKYFQRRYRCHRGQSGKGAFIGGVIVVALLALFQFTAAGDVVRSAFHDGKEAFVSVARSGWSLGHNALFDTGTSFALPVSSGVVVENFGVVADAEGNDAYHNGIDIKVPAGSEVLCAADGTVSDVSEHDDGTVWITVDHSKHWSTVYGRLGEAKVAVGDKVAKGDPLGVPAGEILHFEVREDHLEKDPIRYFNEK